MHLQQQATLFRLEGAMVDTRRPAGVSVRPKPFPVPSSLIIADDEVARDQVNFLPILMNKRPGREYTGLKAQEASPASTFILFIERPGENLLLDALGIARQSFPALVHVE